MSKSLAETMRATTQAVIDDFDGRQSLKTGINPRAPNCVQEHLPTIVGIPTVKTDEEWKARLAFAQKTVHDCEMTIHDYFASVEDRRAMCRCSLVSSSGVGECRNEYIWLLDFDETGEKVTKIVEFMDSHALLEMRNKSLATGLMTVRPAS